MVIIILIAAIFLCQALVRLCMLVARPKTKPPVAVAAAAAADEKRGRKHDVPLFYDDAYAVPATPIRVVLARDEEAAGVGGGPAGMRPPAYGRWRESVRVDPDQVYWQRNPEVLGKAPGLGEEPEVVSDDEDYDDDHEEYVSDEEEGEDEGEEEWGKDHEEDVESRPRPLNLRSPPSYASDDGVNYVVEARPRSIAPVTDVPLPVHPAQGGKVALPARWL